MEQMVTVFMEYADIICIFIGIVTFIISGITLHRLKKLESGLYKTAEKIKTAQTKEQNLSSESVFEEKKLEKSATTGFKGEQEKLLDDVLGEVFP